MAVRRLHPEQPTGFSFNDENNAWAALQVAKYPAGKQASAILPLLWRAQEQCGGWLPEPAIRAVCDQLGMAYIRGLEIATFYTMFQLSPVGSKAHIQVCGTTPCMLRGSKGLIEVCQRRIADHAHELNSDRTLSWEEVECLGNCANAPMVQVDKDTFEDLTPALLEQVIDGYVMGTPPQAGSQIGRTASCPEGGATSLTDASLFDGSTVGAWRKRFDQVAAAAQPIDPPQSTAAVGAAKPSQVAAPETASPAPVRPQILPAVWAAMANAGLVKDLEARSMGKPLAPEELQRLKLEASRSQPDFLFSTSTSQKPELLAAPRNGTPDELALIWGVADQLAEKLNAMGIWHFDQIAQWSPANVAWFEAEMVGFSGRVMRDKWIEQCEKLASGWRPDRAVGEKPKA